MHSITIEEQNIFKGISPLGAPKGLRQRFRQRKKLLKILQKEMISANLKKAINLKPLKWTKSVDSIQIRTRDPMLVEPALNHFTIALPSR